MRWVEKKMKLLSFYCIHLTAVFTYVFIFMFILRSPNQLLMFVNFVLVDEIQQKLKLKLKLNEKVFINLLMKNLNNYVIKYKKNHYWFLMKIQPAIPISLLLHTTTPSPFVLSIILIYLLLLGSSGLDIISETHALHLLLHQLLNIDGGGPGRPKLSLPIH